MCRLLMLAGVTLACLSHFSRADEPTPEQKKRIEELKKQIAEKRIEILKLESELVKLLPSPKVSEGLFGDKPVVQGALAYEVVFARVEKQADGNSRWWIQIKVKNVSEKDNVATRQFASKLAQATVSDDTKRSYIITRPTPPPPSKTAPKDESFLVPGNHITYTLSLPGAPTETAKEVYLTIAGMSDPSPIRIIIPKASITRIGK